MSINGIAEVVTLGQTVYNPERGAFEAEAQLTQGRAVFAYHVRFEAAPYAEFAAVTRGLTAQTLKQHCQGRERTRRFLRDALRRAHASAVGGLLTA